MSKSKKNIKAPQRIEAACQICGDSGSYDEQTIQSCTHNINGLMVIICTNCEDDLREQFGSEEKD